MRLLRCFPLRLPELPSEPVLLQVPEPLPVLALLQVLMPEPLLALLPLPVLRW